MQEYRSHIVESNAFKTAQDSERKLRSGGCHSLRSLFAASSSTGDLRSLGVRNDVDHGTSPKGVLETCRSGEPSVIMESPAYERHDSFSSEKPLSHWRKVVRQWKDKSVKRLSTLPIMHGKKWKREEDDSHDDELDSSGYGSHSDGKTSSWKIFSLSELNVATNYFSEESLIGRGGFAEVYKGCLVDGQLVAIKRLLKGSHEEKNSSFLSELGIIAHLDHHNTAKLVGYGVEGGVHLVLELSSLGSLGSLLRGSRDDLDWATRYKIALGIAEGLIYLHDNCHKRIIHRDIKSDNILLAENYEPQICDFGLALWLPRSQTNYTVMRQEGTFGYIAPEYLMQGLVNEKTDVFAFGVVLLELITGRRALDDSNKSILIWAKPLMDKNKLERLVDPILREKYNKEELERMVLTAALCVDASQFIRPEMSQAVILLRGDKYAESMGKQHLKRTFSEEFLYAKEYNSTKYLNDIRRHRQVAFDSSSDLSSISPRTPQSPPAVL